ncbi:thermonuclease family protein [Niallia sp. XMNu-256]|uniref:thermonuclease family protein n=1 Tax=Niallia sp. XMNu-256 TaxID=3082444 RepID=UPI0030CFC2C8
MKSVKLPLFLLLTITILFGCESEDLTTGQQEETKNDTVQQEEALTDPIETEPEKQENESTKPEQSSDKHTFDAEVVSVTDGDTIKVRINGSVESVRFLLVDTPETNHPRFGEQPFGQEAKDFVKQLLEGRTVQLEKDVGDRDKYGRLLYYLYIDGKSVQEELLRNGLARVAYVYAPNTKYVDQYYAIQKEAQKKGVGIWSIENYAREDGFYKEVAEGTQKSTNSSSEKNRQTSPSPSKTCDIKGNISSSGEKIYHMPGQQYYEVTQIDLSKGEQYFCSQKEAEQAGFRASQR